MNTDFVITLEQISVNSNKVKERLLEALEKEGFLNQSAEFLNTHYCVVVTRKGMLGRIWDKLRHNENNDEIKIGICRDAFSTGSIDIAKIANARPDPGRPDKALI